MRVAAVDATRNAGDEGAILGLLGSLRAETLTYDQWMRVGAAIKGCGLPCEAWDGWSKGDPRYKPGECAYKWPGIGGTGYGALASVVSEVALGRAVDAFGWHDDLVAIPDVHDGRAQPTGTDDRFHLAGECKDETIAQLTAMFEPDDKVNYVNRFNVRGDGRYSPANKGHSDRSRSEIVRDLVANASIGAALGDPDQGGGALLRVNPVDGNGVADRNVTRYRHALVECDDGTPEAQAALMRRLRLPIAAMVFSANKSVHAAVRIDAADKEEYAERVGFLYQHCLKNGLRVDEACKNPSRMMRLAGVTRGGVRQSLLGTNLGFSSWEQWHAWATGSEMPRIVNLASVWDDMPPLAPVMIEGVLRVGHKMLLAGPSKAGKSFMLIQLAIAVAEGSTWLGSPCRQGRVLYVNLEVDHASCLRRFVDVYDGLGIQAVNASNIDVYSLRGHAQPLDKLVPVVVEACEGTDYAMVIIDPIYKVITGDENSATDMAFFTSQLDIIADRMGCCVVYAHHHSKGKQGFKYSLDRMSGSGVFARDPDAILDMSPLVCKPDQLRAGNWPRYRRLAERAMAAAGVTRGPDGSSAEEVARWARKELPGDMADGLVDAIWEIEGARSPHAYRLSYDLREFASPMPTDLWFSYPVHVIDERGLLSEAVVDGAAGGGSETRAKDPCDDISFVYGLVNLGEPNASIQDMADFLGMSTKTVQRRLDKDGHFERKNGLTWPKAG